MNSNSDLSSLRSSRSAWFNLKYLLLFLNMILVYINSGLFFYLFTKDFRKVQQFNLKDYPNLRYVTQISSDRINQSPEPGSMKSHFNNVPHYSDSQDEVNYDRNRLMTNQKYKALDEVVSMFGQQENTFSDDDNRREPEKQLNDLKRVGLMGVLRNRKVDQSTDLANRIPAGQTSQVGPLNQPNLNNNNNNQLIESSKRNKTLIKKSTDYNDLYSLNKQLSLIYLLLGLNNFLNFICLTKELRSSLLLTLQCPPIFTILPLIITKFNYEINLRLFAVYIVIGLLTLLHVKRLKKQSTSERIIVHSPSRIYHNFTPLDSTSIHPTSTQQFLITHDLDSCKSSLSGKEKSNNYNLVSGVADKKSDQIPAIKRIMNFKQMTPPPSYDQAYPPSTPSEI